MRLYGDERCCEVVRQGLDRGDDVAPELEGVRIGIADRGDAGVGVSVWGECEGEQKTAAAIARPYDEGICPQ